MFLLAMKVYCLAIGILMLYSSLKTFWRSRNAILNWKLTKAIVTSVRKYTSDERLLYNPIIIFCDDRNIQHIVKLDESLAEDITGKDLIVLYNPINPKEVILKNSYFLYWRPLFLAVIGIIFLLGVFFSYANNTSGADYY